MLELPIPIFAAIVLVYLLIRGVFRSALPLPIAAILVLCAGQAVIVTCVQHYNMSALLRVQAIVAGMIPPVAFLGFLSVAVRRLELARDWIHMLGPAFITFCALGVPAALDAALFAIYVGYGLAMFFGMRGGADTLLRTRLDGSDTSLLIWRVVASFLLVSAVADILIAVSYVMGLGEYRGIAASLAYSVQLLVIGALSLSRVEPQREESEPVDATPVAPQDDDIELVNRLRSKMEEAGWYTEPDLTLNTLSRRLVVPAKTLSSAVNKVTGDNVSRFINGYRIRHACDRLAAGETRVTAAMFESGFETKSNFNREFRRITGQSPSDWIKTQRQVVTRAG